MTSGVSCPPRCATLPGKGPLTAGLAPSWASKCVFHFMVTDYTDEEDQEKRYKEYKTLEAERE